MLPLAAFFRELDGLGDRGQTTQYHCSEVLVQTQLDVPIPLTAGMRVELEFTTTNGDISFSMHFSAVTESGGLETVMEQKQRE